MLGVVIVETFNTDMFTDTPVLPIFIGVALVVPIFNIPVVSMLGVVIVETFNTDMFTAIPVLPIFIGVALVVPILSIPVVSMLGVVIVETFNTDMFTGIAVLPIFIDVAVPVPKASVVAESNDVPVIANAPIDKPLVAVGVQLSSHTAVVPLLLNTCPIEPAVPAILRFPKIFVAVNALPNVTP